jgi:cation transport regulator
MPYQSIADLPESVRTHLPPHAQEIFLAAFNHAYEAHKGEPDDEATAFRIAWGAVKRDYEKIGERWTRKTS